MRNEYIETLAREEWNANEQLREEFDNDFKAYLAWREADHQGQIKILNH